MVDADGCVSAAIFDTEVELNVIVSANIRGYRVEADGVAHVVHEHRQVPGLTSVIAFPLFEPGDLDAGCGVDIAGFFSRSTTAGLTQPRSAVRLWAQNGGLRGMSARRIVFKDGVGMRNSPQMIGLSPIVGYKVLKLLWVVMFGPPLCFATRQSPQTDVVGCCRCL